MGHSRAEKSDSRERILQAAARRFRERGVEGLGIAELMEEAGLTHGGFYRHFESREDLVTQAIVAALAQNLDRMSDAAERSPKAALHGMIDRYLSAAHRDAPGEGCTIASLVADAARGSERTRSAYTEHVRHFIDLIVPSMKNGGPRAKRRHAMLTLSAMAGALMLARAVNDEALSDEILQLTSRALKECNAEEPSERRGIRGKLPRGSTKFSGTRGK